MKHIKFILINLLLGLAVTSHSQEIRSAYFTIADYRSGIQQIELEINNFIVVMDGQANLLFTEPNHRSGHPNAFKDLEYSPDGRLRGKDGVKIEYYDDFDKNKAGKIKSINGIPLDYYSNFDIHEEPGRLKSIGKISFKYHNAFDIHDEQGSLKSLGSISLKYYTAFDIHDQKGNVKSIGPVSITWFNSFDQAPAKGRVKSIKGNTSAIYVAKVIEGRAS